MHHVYYLLDPELGSILYVGRSQTPKSRCADFIRLKQRKVVLGVCQRHRNLEDAQKAEIEAITKHQPAYNKYVASSKGKIGISHVTKETVKLKLSLLLRGRPKTEEHKAKIAAAHVGKKHTLEARQKMKQSQAGVIHRPHSELTKQRIAEGQRRRYAKKKISGE